MSEAEFLNARDVSRETLARLRNYESLLRKWNPAINLVSRSTLDQLWTRHFLDSAQIFDQRPAAAESWADLGSGGGFPGLVVAILAADAAPGLRMTLIESDSRKAAFLTTATRDLGLTADIRAARIETLSPLDADVLSARALAPLPTLLGYAERHLGASGTALFPKGANHADELRRALVGWRFSHVTTPSLTDPDAVIYRITEIARA